MSLEVCGKVSNALASVWPLSTYASQDYHNTWGYNEKWFRDRTGQWYYMYPDRPSLPPGVVARTGRIVDDKFLPVVVRKWNGGMQANNASNIERDNVILSDESYSCFERVSGNYAFPPHTVCRDLVGVVQQQFGTKDLAAPYVSPGGIAYNWAGFSEKWFLDSRKQWYYVYGTTDKAMESQPTYWIYRWDMGAKYGSMSVGVDEMIGITNRQCYEAIAPGFVFPNPW